MIDAKADFGMQAAVLSGLAQRKSAIDGQMSLGCSSGNCTWEAVQSLAVCSICNDVTKYLRHGRSQQPAVMFLSRSNFAASLENATAFSLGDGVFLNNVDGRWDDNSTVPDFLAMTAYGTGDPERTTSLKDVDTLIWASGIIRADWNKPVAAMWPDDFTVSATECGLYYCVKEYQVEMKQNKVVETSKEIKSERRDPRSWQYLDQSAHRRLNQSTANPKALASPAWINWAAERSDLQLGDAFNVSQAAVISLSFYMNQTFTRDDTAPFNASDPGNPYRIAGYYIGNQTRSEYEPGVMQALYDSEDLGATFEGLAASMSNVMRAHDSSDAVATGELGQLVASYRIAWPWIALPAVVVVASVAQLIVTIASNDKSPMWKSSTLATLSRGYRAREVLGEATTLHDLRVAAGKGDVGLLDNGHVAWPRGRQSDWDGVELLTVSKQGATTTAVEEYDSHESLLRR